MMSNILKRRNLSERRGPAGTFLALTLAASLAAFGCTTNRVPGDGEPVRGGTYVAPAATPGSSGGTTGINVGPMFSSSRVYEHQGVTPGQAAALAASDGLPSVRYLGPVSPGSSPTGNNPMPTGQFSWPAIQANPQVTVNSSSSSPPVPTVNSGAGDALAATNVLNSANGTVSGTTTGTTTSGGAVIQTAVGTTTPTPAGAALPLTGGTTVGTSTTSVTPTASSGLVTSPTLAASNARLGTPTGTTVARTSRTTAAATARTVANATGNIRLITNANGVVTLTNVAATTPVATGAAAVNSNATTNATTTVKGTTIAPVASEKPQQ